MSHILVYICHSQHIHIIIMSCLLFSLAIHSLLIQQILEINLDGERANNNRIRKIKLRTFAPSQCEGINNHNTAFTAQFQQFEIQIEFSKSSIFGCSSTRQREKKNLYMHRSPRKCAMKLPLRKCVYRWCINIKLK